MMHLIMAVSLVLHSCLASGEHREIWAFPETVPASSEVGCGFPLQRVPVKRPGYISGASPHGSDLPHATDNISFVTRIRQKSNQADNKIVATSAVSSSPVDENLAFVSTIVVPRRGQLDTTIKRNKQKFPDKSLLENDKIRQTIFDNETNNHYLPETDFNYFQPIRRQKTLIPNSILKHETKENKISFFNYLSLTRFGNNSRWKSSRNHIHKRKLLKERSSTEMDKTDRIKDKRHFPAISLQGQGYALKSNDNFSKSSQGDKFKIFGRRLYINRKRFVPESRAHVDSSRAHGRIRRGFHFDYEDREDNDTPETAPGPADVGIILEPMPVVIEGMSSFINPSFDSINLKELAKLKLQTISKRLFDASTRRDASGQFRQPQNLDINRFAPFLRHKPSGLLRNLPIFDQNQDAKYQFHTGADGRVFHLSHKHLGTREFNVPNTGYLPEKYLAQISKRNFDVIGEGALSGMKQNHVGKRFVGLFPIRNHFTRNTDIPSAKVDSRPDITTVTTLDSLENDIDNSRSGNILQAGNDDYLYGSGIDAALNSYYDTIKPDTWPNDNFDSIKKLTVRTNRQQFKDNNEINYLSGITSGDEEMEIKFQEKRLDAISNGALGGIRQNFLDKKYFQSHSKQTLPWSVKDVLSSKYPHETSSEVKDYSQNDVSKTNLNKFAPPRIRWRMNMNYDNDRKRPPKHFSADRKSKPGFPKKRNTDFIFPSHFNPISQTFLDPAKILDKNILNAISTSVSVLKGLGQNYFRQNNLNSNKVLSRLNKLYLNLLAKRNFPLRKTGFINSHKTVDSSAGLNPGDQLRFTNKRRSDILEEVRPNLVGDDDGDNDGDDDDDDDDDDDYISYEKLYLDLLFGIGFFDNLNRSHKSHTGDERMPFYSAFRQMESETNRPSVVSVPVNVISQAGDNISNLNKDFPEKRSLDAIAGLSPISGLAQNFIETKGTQHRPIGSMPWSRFSKRNLGVYSSDLNDNEDSYRQYFDLLTEFSPKTNSEDDNRHGYDRMSLLLDLIQPNSFLNKVPNSKEDIRSNVDTKDHVYEFM